LANSFNSIIVAGGLSSRLFPLTDENHPKWLLKIGKGSLLEQTIERSKDLYSQNIFLLTSAKQVDLIKYKEPNLQKFGEPEGKNTYASFGLGAFLSFYQDENSLFGFFPADHLVQNTEEYKKTITKAIDLLQTDPNNIITIGIHPTYPSPEYGYLETKGNDVLRFTEKPDENKAQTFLNKGNYYWNSGVFLSSAMFIYEYIRSTDTKTFEILDNISQNLIKNKENDWLNWSELEKISVDYKIMEPLSQQNHIKFFPSTFNWNDIGTFESLKNGGIFDL